MIEELTPEQVKIAEETRDHWLSLLDTKFDEDKAREWIKWLYSFCQFDEPEIVVVGSPMAIQDKCNELNGTTGVYYDTSSYGNISDFGWLSFYDAFAKMGVVKHEGFEEFKKIQHTGIYDMVQFDTHCVVCGMPDYIHRDEEHRLHADGSPAIAWGDGFKRHYLHGTAVPEYLAITPAEDLEISFYNKENSADIRTEFIRKFGMERMREMGKKLDSWENYTSEDLDEQSLEWYQKSQYELYDMAKILPGVDYAPHLKMRHMTMDMDVMEPVSPGVHTIKEALDDRNGVNTGEFQIMDIK
jgi:hypothetical protein